MHANATVSYFSRKVKFPVPDSTCYAELNVIVATLKESIFASHVIADMFGATRLPLIVTDSKAAHDIIKNPGVTKHSIHFERWIYLARDYYLHGKAKYLQTGTANMMADARDDQDARPHEVLPLPQLPDEHLSCPLLVAEARERAASTTGGICQRAAPRHHPGDAGVRDECGRDAHPLSGNLPI